jgi:hypothetical protein
MFKKLLTTPCLIALLFSCGKNIESSNDQKKTVTTPALETSNILLKVNYLAEESNYQAHNYQITGSGWARIPESPMVLEGSPLTFKTTISLNVSLLDVLDNSQEINCEYLSFRKLTPTEDPDSDGYNHSFKGCFTTIDGIKELVNYNPGQEFPIDKGNQLIFEVNNSDTSGSIEIQSDIEVDWH